MPTLKRTIYFYLVQRRRRNSVFIAPADHPIEWKTLLTEFSKKPWKDRKCDDTLYTAILNKRYPILSIAESIDTRFLARLDEEHEEISDLADTSISRGDVNLAQMSAILFYPKHDIVAFVTGSGRPALSIAERFFNVYIPNNSFKWELTPLFTPDGLQEFKDNFQSVQRFETRFSTQKNLFNAVSNNGDLVELGERISRQIKSDIDIQISVSLPSTSKNGKPAQRLKEFLLNSIPFIAQQNKRIQIKGLTVGNILTDLNLLSHPLTHEAELPNSNEPQQFTQLLDTLINVCADNENEAYELLER